MFRIPGVEANTSVRRGVQKAQELIRRPERGHVHRIVVGQERFDDREPSPAARSRGSTNRATGWLLPNFGRDSSVIGTAAGNEAATMWCTCSNTCPSWNPNSQVRAIQETIFSILSFR